MPPIFFTICANLVYWVSSSWTSRVATPDPRATRWILLGCLLKSFAPSLLSSSAQTHKHHVNQNNIFQSDWQDVESAVISCKTFSYILSIQSLKWHHQRRLVGSFIKILVFSLVFIQLMFKNSMLHLFKTLRAWYYSVCVCYSVLPWSFMLSMMVISFFSLAIDSCSFPLLMKSVPKPGIIPCTHSIIVLYFNNPADTSCCSVSFLYSLFLTLTLLPSRRIRVRVGEWFTSSFFTVRF